MLIKLLRSKKVYRYIFDNKLKNIFKLFNLSLIYKGKIMNLRVLQINHAKKEGYLINQKIKRLFNVYSFKVL